MKKASAMHCALLRFWVPLLLLASFSFAPSVLAKAEISGNEVNTHGKVVSEELTKSSLKEQNEEEKFKGFFPKPIPIIKPISKPIPIIKPIPKSIPIVKPIPIPVYKPISKPIPIVKPIPKPFLIVKPIPNDEEKFKGVFPKPIPIVKPIPKPIPIVKPIPIPIYKPIPKSVPIVKPIPIIKPILKPNPIVKPIPKLIPIVKPIPNPLRVKKSIPAFGSEEFLKPKPFFEKPIPKLPLDPKFKKPLLPPLPIHKPIPTP
ncbi:hypothetical protein JHK82_043614 [Glycine max]|uniref:Uncharacterized protein n=1 Tax=Glycine max TaxID=3847 RepID=C6T741_SOYBN|nr:uncharacterized protein LOC100798749 precursor [Glycine max]ACU17643.1 unknown [Glycine max]KAG4950262.1 hypothetical protein JHK86_043501 [Glycine max]KAG4957781.1 hypothetical protein JHK85_044161 [Glycine max]KAG5106644.1 hypothetical protein JHK82_043614 [Glycine max]KRH13441.1 hypothetical protein GLYMA_15G239200v4 [Glycine max]|eukprot:NP_001239776.1 uncharacterized protein LOC100798749 precursor [Glycine max]